MTGYRSCIYKIENVVSGKTYIGSTVNFPIRKSVHLHSLRNGRHRNKHLQSSYDKHGESALVFTKLLVCERIDLLFFEQRAIDILNPEYNIHRFAGSPRGHHHSPETLEKMRKSWVARNPGDYVPPVRRYKPCGGHTDEGKQAIAKHQRERGRGKGERRKIALSVGNFTEEQVLRIRKLRADGMKLTELVEIFGTSAPVISRIANRKTYRWL